MSPLSKAQSLLAKPVMSAVYFFSGVAYDTLTLTRIDRLQDNLILLSYLVILGLLIVLTGRWSIGPATGRGPVAEPSPAMQWAFRMRPYYPMAMQFLLGSLFSAYAVFYSRSTTLTGTAVFFLLLVVLLVANEFLRGRLSSIRFLVSLYAVVAFSFCTFVLPVMTGSMNSTVFLSGAVLSVAVTVGIVLLMYRNDQGRSLLAVAGAVAPAVALIGLLVGFYFLNWIPPVPLSLKHGGVYHEIKKAGDRFELSFEKQWYQVWKRSDDIFPADEPGYCFSAVFAPVDLQTTIYHHWYFRANAGRPFVHADRIPLKISGGREGGYRVYSFKQRLDQGDWRVDVETEDGRVIGRISVTVEPQAGAPPALATVSY